MDAALAAERAAEEGVRDAQQAAALMVREATERAAQIARRCDERIRRVHDGCAATRDRHVAELVAADHPLAQFRADEAAIDGVLDRVAAWLTSSR